MKKMNAKWILGYILVPVLIAVLSSGIVAKRAPEWQFFQQTVDHLDESKETVMKMSGVALSTSVAITMLPSDYANSIANELAAMQKYFVGILAIIFLERMLAVSGIAIACRIVIPAACGVWFFSGLMKEKTKIYIESFAKRLMILGISILMIVPLSTRVSDVICAEYLTYVDDTLDQTDEGVAVINDTMLDTEEGESALDKLSDLFSTAVDSVTDMVEYFKDVIRKFVNSVAILIVANCLVPLLTMSGFVWLLKQLFGIQISPMLEIDRFGPFRKKQEESEDGIGGHYEAET